MTRCEEIGRGIRNPANPFPPMVQLRQLDYMNRAVRGESGCRALAPEEPSTSAVRAGNARVEPNSADSVEPCLQQSTVTSKGGF
jgi:hypothetical protein